MGSLQQFTGKMSSYLSHVQSSFRLGSNKKKGNKIRSTAIELNDYGFAVAEVAREAGKIKIINCQFIHNTNQQIRAELISEMINRRGISTAHVSIVLTGNSYKFLLAEAPDSSIESLRFIMPNKIKDSLPWKLTETTVDVLPLPGDAFKGRKKSVYVAAANTKNLEKQIMLLKDIHIEPDSITTIEMAIKAYWEVIKPQPKTSIGILRITENGGVIVMMCDGAVYLARRIIVDLGSLGEEGVNKQEVFDQVVLEIQRSVDFYESQLGKGTVSQVIMLTPPIDLGIGLDYIEQNISTDISIINPLEKMGYEHDMTIKDQAYCTGAIGAAIEGLNNA